MLNWLKDQWCNFAHGGGGIERNSSGALNWRCSTCGRWHNASVPLAEERRVVDAAMSGTDPAELYRCGNVPMAGDLVSFGSRDTRMIVSRVLYHNDATKLLCGDAEYSLPLTRLIARHGQPETPRT